MEYLKAFIAFLRLFVPLGTEDSDKTSWTYPGLDSRAQHLYNDYLRQIYTSHEDEASLPSLDIAYPSEKTSPRPGEVTDETRTERLPLLDAVEDNQALLLTGPPGAGKTVALRQVVRQAARQAADGPLAFSGAEGVFQKFSRLVGDADPTGNQPPFPVYVSPGDRSVYYRIAIELHSKGVGDSSPSKEWVFEALKEGLLFVAVDDAHRFDTDELKDLLRYSDRSPILLVGRDTKQLRSLSLQRVTMAPLTDDQQESILSEYLDDRVSVAHHALKNDELQALASRPQTLCLLAQTYAENEHFYSDKRTLFDEALKQRYKELGGESEIDELWCVRRFLNSLAFRMASGTTPYFMSIPKARGNIADTLSVLKKDFGVSGLTVNSVIDTLDERGHLRVGTSNIRFEHDQWEEFFAAEELVDQGARLDDLGTEEMMREVSLFAASKQTLEDRIWKNRAFWKGFWSMVSHLDPFWALKCERQIDFRERRENDISTVVDVEKIVEDIDEPSDEDIRSSFREYLDEYKSICNKHFPRLQEIFPPHGEEQISIAVERRSEHYGRMKCFTKKEGLDQDVCVIDDVTDETRWDEIVEWRSSHAALRSIPILEVMSDIKRNLKRGLKDEKLWESDALLRERAYYEGVSLFQVVSGEEIPSQFHAEPLFIQLQKALSSRSKGTLLKHTTAYREREVKLEDWRTTLEMAKSRGISLKPLSPPIPPPWIKAPPLDGEALQNDEFEALAQWSTDLFESVFRNLHALVEGSFPTTKELFPHYEYLFPALVFLVPELSDDREHKRPDSRYRDCILGTSHSIQLRDQSAPLVQVQIADEKDQVDKAVEEIGTGNGIVGPWRPNFRYDVPPIRNRVYRLVRNDLEKLLEGRR